MLEALQKDAVEMDRVKRFFDWVVRAPPSTVLEAERENMQYDESRLDQSIGRMIAVKDEFAEIVAQVVRDVGHERRQRRAHAKTHTRSRKT
jgi:hypothetical protein